MGQFEVSPLPDYEDELLEEYETLPLECAHGFSKIFDTLKASNPNLKDRCGLMSDRFEVFAIPLPDCMDRNMIVSIDTKDTYHPRYVHGTLISSVNLFQNSARLAAKQFGLNNPTWEQQL